MLIKHNPQVEEVHYQGEGPLRGKIIVSFNVEIEDRVETHEFYICGFNTEDMRMQTREVRYWARNTANSRGIEDFRIDLQD